KDDAERLIETAGALDFVGQHGGEVARVEEMRAVVGDGEFLDAFDSARVFDGDGGVVADDVEEGDGVVSERLRRGMRDLQDAEGTLARTEWQADGGVLLLSAGEPGGNAVIGDDERLAVQRYPSRHAGAERDADALQRFVGDAAGKRVVEVASLLIDHEQ